MSIAWLYLLINYMHILDLSSQVNECDFQALRENFRSTEAIIELLADIEGSEKLALGYSIADLVLDCQFEGAACLYRSDQIHHKVNRLSYIFSLLNIVFLKVSIWKL